MITIKTNFDLFFKRDTIKYSSSKFVLNKLKSFVSNVFKDALAITENKQAAKQDHK